MLTGKPTGPFSCRSLGRRGSHGLVEVLGVLLDGSPILLHVGVLARRGEKSQQDLHGFVMVSGVEQRHGEERLKASVVGVLQYPETKGFDSTRVLTEHPVGASEAEQRATAVLVRQSCPA